MSQILEGQEGILCLVDDVLIFAPTQQEHDIRLHAALAKIQAAGLTLNKEKCEFNKERLTFLGHMTRMTRMASQQTQRRHRQF